MTISSLPTLRRAQCRVSLLLLSLCLLSGASAWAQSVLGSVSGTVRDSSGAAIPNAIVLLHRTETNSDRTVTTGSAGTYNAINIEAGTYNISASAEGFATKIGTGVTLAARQQLQYDVALNASQVAQTVTINAAAAGVIETETAEISASLSAKDVLDLPANYRGAGSTSPINVVQTLPGVQADTAASSAQPSTHPVPQVRFSLQGGLPSQTETTIDGISAQNQTANNLQNDAFPSAEAISEIRVDGVNNNAEYGQPGEITVVTKAGTNHPHGSVYEYLQNQFLDATPYGDTTKPHKVANDFGGSFGGPVFIPHLYDGRDKTFFFFDYEGLRFPLSTVIRTIVPTAREKQGDFSQETTTPLVNPFTPGAHYAGNVVQNINPTSAKFLQFYPDPNIGGDLPVSTVTDGKHLGYNYLSTRPNGINSNQYDLRGDRFFGQRAFLVGRFTSKNVNQVQPADLALPNSTAFATYRSLATSFIYNFTPKVSNEFRFGFTLERDGNSNPFNGNGFNASTGLVDTTVKFFNGIPHLQFNQINSVGSRLGFEERSRIFQYVDNVSLQLGKHSVRIGADIRQLEAYTEAGAGYDNFLFSSSAGSTATGNEFADFLIGVPYQTQTNQINQDNDGTAKSYSFYAQDSWKATPRLTITYGLRYDFHPAFVAKGGLAGNFDPSIPRTGRLIYPAGYASALNVQELANVNACITPGVTNPYANSLPYNGVPCTPVVTNEQAGLPAGLRSSPKLRFQPRFGFAYQPSADGRTVIRGGAGYYNITTTGALFYAITQTLQANSQIFNNAPTPTGPAIVFPNVSAAGTNAFKPVIGSLGFYSAIDTNWHDPYSLQTDLSIDHDFGHNIGGRISYIGLQTFHLVWQPQFNQLSPSSTTIWNQRPQTDFPFPNFNYIVDRATAAEAHYNALQLEVSHRLTHGLSFNSAYTFSKNLSDNQGTASNFNGAGFVDEQGGYGPTDTFDRHRDYGNVGASRRHRWISTGIYELPIGRGKRYGAHLNRFADAAVGGWQISNIFLLQSGTFLTASYPYNVIDPSGTGSGPFSGANQRPDRVANGNASHRTRAQWFNPNAFACPGQGPGTALGCNVGTGIAPIGRFGTESIGDLVGPGTVNLSSGLSKSIYFTESFHLRGEATFTNVLNHTNNADPQTDISQGTFGQITGSRGSDFGGNRTGQLSLKLEF